MIGVMAVSRNQGRIELGSNGLPVYLREVGRPDDQFEDPMRGLDDLLARLASRMA